MCSRQSHAIQIWTFFTMTSPYELPLFSATNNMWGMLFLCLTIAMHSTCAKNREKIVQEYWRYETKRLFVFSSTICKSLVHRICENTITEVRNFTYFLRNC